jgi:hypothetical protein
VRNYACPFCKKDFGSRAKTIDEARIRYAVFMARLEELVQHMTGCRKETSEPKTEGSLPR